MKRQLIGMVGSVAALALLASCAEDPTAALRGDVARVSLSRSYVELDVGQSLDLQAQAYDSQGNALATLPEVASSDASILTVTVNERLSGDPLPELVFTVTAVAYGQATITATAGGVSASGTVQTWPAAIELTGVPDLMRSGETATLVVTPVDVNGTAVAGVSGITLANSTPTVATLDTATKLVTAILVGHTVITASGPGGSTGEQGVTVVPGVPASAALAAATFGAVASAGTSTREVRVLDAAGNQNINLSEITAISATSDDEAVATVAASFTDDVAEGERRAYVTATGVSAGTANISGTVTTTEGTFAFAAAPVTVLAPLITASNPTAAPGGQITISGSGLAATGFTTEVLIDGRPIPVTDIVSTSATSVVANMPAYGSAGAHTLHVSVGGVVSANSDTYTQIGAFVEATTETNDVKTDAPTISVDFSFSGTTGGGDGEDMFLFRVGASTTVNVTLTWDTGKDFDVTIMPYASAIPFNGSTFANYGADVCGGAAATGAKPEITGNCTLAAGLYILHVIDFDQAYSGDATPTIYTVAATIIP